MLYPRSLLGSDPLYPQDSDFEVISVSDLVGKGVISYRGFAKGEVLAKMAGHVVPDIRQHTLQIDSEKHLYDPYFSGYFLHSCSPNISLDMKNLVVTALKDIPADSLLYMDYAETEDHLFKQFACSCGSNNCRGWVMGKKDVHPDLVQAHQTEVLGSTG